MRPQTPGCHTRVYSPPLVDRIQGIWGSYYHIPKAIFYLLKGDYRVWTDGQGRLPSRHHVDRFCMGPLRRTVGYVFEKGWSLAPKLKLNPLFHLLKGNPKP